MTATESYYELQLVPYIPDDGAGELYQRVDGIAMPAEASLLEMQHERRRVSLALGGELDLNTFFGRYHEVYWQRHTSIRDVFLVFRLKGKVRFQLVRHVVRGQVEQLLCEKELSADDSVMWIPVPEPEKDAGTQASIAARFIAMSEGATIADVRWETTTPPQNEVHLAAVICTFNREKDLAAILTGLETLRGEGLIKEIIVVNNGQPGLEKRLRPLLPPEAQNMPLVLREQDNFGGCGGFTRGMLEARASGQSTHALLLDDDIVITPVILRRIPILLRYINKNVAVGSYMLDRLQPSWLHNTVTQLRPDLLKSVPAVANCDLGLIENLEPFSKITSNDSCGWWCFAFPLEILDKTNLPLPFFLHYDDVEFGLRLKREGVETVVWPGVAIWHEPFYMKAKSWRRYYDLRNMLFLLKFHRRLGWFSVTRQLWARFTMNIMQFHYDSTWATIRALEDFLIGPLVLARWDGAAHLALMTEAKEWQEPDLPLATALSAANRLGEPPRSSCLWALKGAWRLLCDFIRPYKSNPRPKVVEISRWHIWVAEGYDALAVPDDTAGVYHVYRRDRKKAWRLLCRFLRAYMLFIVGAGRHWGRADLNDLTTPSFWRGRLGVGGDG